MDYDLVFAFLNSILDKLLQRCLLFHVKQVHSYKFLNLFFIHRSNLTVLALPFASESSVPSRLGLCGSSLLGKRRLRCILFLMKFKSSMPSNLYQWKSPCNSFDELIFLLLAFLQLIIDFEEKPAVYISMCNSFAIISCMTLEQTLYTV